MKLKFKKILLNIFLVIALIVSNFSVALALEAPTAPTAPSAPTAPNTPSAPVAPSSNFEPPTPPAPPEEPEEPAIAIKEPIAPKPPKVINNNNEDYSEGQVSNENNEDLGTIVSQENGNEENGGNVGDTTINTGDGTLNNLLFNDANNNFLVWGECEFDCGNSGGASVVNSGNGTDSTNDASAQTTNNTNIDQNNNLYLVNNYTGEVETGNNDSDRNVGNTEILTGDADISLTLVNSGNNNEIIVGFQEFDVYDNQVGDITFSWADPTLFTSGAVTVENTGNGSNSNNSASSTSENNTDITQVNVADVENNVLIETDTGNNSASRNTGGDSIIETGDANIVANLINFLNNNITGTAEFLVGVVNIFGTLQGDIIVEAPPSCSCGSSTLAQNSGNGSDSTNNAEINLDNSTKILQNNDATINNNINIDATTGGNETSKNTGGNSTISTGEANVNAEVINVANNNLVGAGDTWWIVLVNNNGVWQGKIVGENQGVNLASDTFDFIINPDGTIAAINSGNGIGSQNSATINSDNNTNIDQSNIANINNNLTIDANTGGNSASRNTGGNSTIKTGDVNVNANIFNFLNNNFTGGRFVITVVNVFGNFLGDVVPAGRTKEVVTIPSQNQVTTEETVAAQTTSESEKTTPEDNQEEVAGVSGVSNNGRKTFGIGSLLAQAASTVKGEKPISVPLAENLQPPGPMFNWWLLSLIPGVLIVYLILIRREAGR